MKLFQSLLKRGQKSGPVLGATFSGRRARMLLVEPGAGGFQLGPGVVFAFGQNTFVGADGVITNPDGLAMELQGVLEQDALLGAMAVLTIGTNQVIIRREHGLPRIAKSELKARILDGNIDVKFKIRDGNSFDASYLGTGGGSGAEVVLVQARRELSSSCQIAAIQAGLNVIGVMAEPIAVYNAMRLTVPEILDNIQSGEARIVIHIGDNASFAMIFDEQGPEAVAWAAYGLENLIQAIGQEYSELSAEEVEEILFDKGAAGQFGAVYTQWSEEILRRTTRPALASMLQDGRDVTILITGEGAVIQDLEETFSSLLKQGPGETGTDIQVLLFDPIDNLAGGEVVRTRWAREGAAYAVQLGAAVAALTREMP